jgi:hypothetical protein
MKETWSRVFVTLRPYTIFTGSITIQKSMSMASLRSLPVILEGSCPFVQTSSAAERLSALTLNLPGAKIYQVKKHDHEDPTRTATREALAHLAELLSDDKHAGLRNELFSPSISISGRRRSVDTLSAHNKKEEPVRRVRTMDCLKPRQRKLSSSDFEAITHSEFGCALATKSASGSEKEALGDDAQMSRPCFEQSLMRESMCSLPDLQCGPVLNLGEGTLVAVRAPQHIAVMPDLSGGSGAEEQELQQGSESGQKTKGSSASSSSSKSVAQQRRPCVCDENLAAARIECWAERGARKRQAKLQSAW